MRKQPRSTPKGSAAHPQFRTRAVFRARSLTATPADGMAGRGLPTGRGVSIITATATCGHGGKTAAEAVNRATQAGEWGAPRLREGHHEHVVGHVRRQVAWRRRQPPPMGHPPRSELGRPRARQPLASGKKRVAGDRVGSGVGWRYR